MKIEYLVARTDGSHVRTGVIDSDSARDRRRLAHIVDEAWEDGHAIITRPLSRSMEGR